MNFFQLMKLLNVETSEMRLLRHTNREIDVLSTFNENLPKFEAYQGFQKEKAFGKAKNIAAFSALPSNIVAYSYPIIATAVPLSKSISETFI